MAFNDLIESLGEELGIDLHADFHGLCQMMINEKLKVQLEADTTGEFLLIVSMICDLPPGKFRENILKDALKANYKIQENYGILSYIGPENSLALFNHIPMHGLTGKELYEHLSIFVQRALGWQKAIDEGFSSPPDSNEVPKADSVTKNSLFGFQDKT